MTDYWLMAWGVRRIADIVWVYRVIDSKRRHENVCEKIDEKRFEKICEEKV